MLLTKTAMLLTEELLRERLQVIAEEMKSSELSERLQVN